MTMRQQSLIMSVTWLIITQGRTYIFSFWSRSVFSAVHHRMHLLCRRSPGNCLRYSFHRRVGGAKIHRTWAGPPRVVQRWRPLSFDACVPYVLADTSPPLRHLLGECLVLSHTPWRSDVSSCLSSLYGASSRRLFPHKVAVAAERTWMLVSGDLVGCLARLLGTHPSPRWPAARVFASPGAHVAPDAAFSQPPRRHLEQ